MSIGRLVDIYGCPINIPNIPDICPVNLHGISVVSRASICHFFIIKTGRSVASEGCNGIPTCKGALTNLENYRPISLTCTCYKFLEQGIGLQRFLDNNVTHKHVMTACHT